MKISKYTHLEHNITNVIDALCDRLSRSRNRNSPLSRIGKHFRGDLNGCARHFSDFLDLRPALPDQRAALTRGHDESESNGRSWNAAATAINLLELGTPLREPVVNTTVH